MRAYIFFSVHEELFHQIAQHLTRLGVTEWSGFVWSEQQKKTVSGRGVSYDPLLVFTKDFLPLYDDGQPADLVWLAERERQLGVSIQRMLDSERHLLRGRTHGQIMRMAELALRKTAGAFDHVRPSFIFSEDISCFHSYVHFVLARERRIPFWCIGSGRIPDRVSVYSAGLQHWERFENLVAELQARGLEDSERQAAEEYVARFRERPVRPTGMKTRARKPRIELADIGRFRFAAARFLGDPDDPTATPPHRMIRQRLARMMRVASTELTGVFEKPVADEMYVFFPLHYQPESSTLVQAPLYVDQLALLRDIASSLPIGYRLYVKEHVSSRGRRTLNYYEAIRAIPAARLLGPDEDTWTLIRNADAIMVITGTVGWEALMFGKPVVTFGDTYYNLHPSVYRAGQFPKDEWYRLFQRAMTSHLHDHEAVLVLASALQQASYPGFIANPNTFPEVLEPDNVRRLADALARELGLSPQV